MICIMYLLMKVVALSDVVLVSALVVDVVEDDDGCCGGDGV